MSFDGYIFDIEGTLIDCVPQTLSSLHDTLREWGLSVPYESLQLYSGLDGDETLKIIAPSLAEEERKRLLAANGKRYEKIYLPRVKAFAGVRELFEAIKAGSGSIALATDCKGLSLKVYRSLLDVDNFIDHVACGEDVHRGKPDPGLVDLAIEKTRPSRRALRHDRRYTVRWRSRPGCWRGLNGASERWLLTRSLAGSRRDPRLDPDQRVEVRVRGKSNGEVMRWAVSTASS